MIKNRFMRQTYKKRTLKRGKFPRIQTILAFQVISKHIKNIFISS
jgi:hypothetical protein